MPSDFVPLMVNVVVCVSASELLAGRFTVTVELPLAAAVAFAVVVAPVATTVGVSPSLRSVTVRVKLPDAGTD